MDKNQYEFSNMFWDDAEWDIKDGLPKYYSVEDDGNMIFHYLDKEELKEFLNIKLKENPDLLRDLRYKKMIRILKNN